MSRTLRLARILRTASRYRLDEFVERETQNMRNFIAQISVSSTTLV